MVWKYYLWDNIDFSSGARSKTQDVTIDIATVQIPVVF